MKAISPLGQCALPLVLLAIACGRDARIHEPQRSQDGFSISPASVSDVSDWSAPVNLGPTVNSAANDLAAELSKDALSLYFASNRPGGSGANDLYVSQRASVDDPWGPPTNLAMLNTVAGDAGPHLSRDGHWLFFTSQRAGGSGGNDIYVSYRANTHDDFAWEAPVNIGPPVNTVQSELGPSTWGPEFYFWRGPPTPISVPGDIYVSRMRGRDFDTPELVAELSSSGHDEKPGIRFDGRQIVISSDRPGTVGGLDIWLATRQGNGHAWGTPVNVLTINSSLDDRRPSFSPDGTMLFFDSNRPGGSGLLDLYVSTRLTK
jgi:WD40-like Beta Propeller Repeat